MSTAPNTVLLYPQPAGAHCTAPWHWYWHWRRHPWSPADPVSPIPWPHCQWHWQAQAPRPRGPCHMCRRPLQPVGSARKNGKAHADWPTRCYHKKCWKNLKREWRAAGLLFRGHPPKHLTPIPPPAP